MQEPHLKTFWNRVNKTSTCWLWNSYKTGAGYGQIKFKQKVYSAHRLSWEIKNGKITNGMFVLHKCDVRECVNPNHLFLGTQGDNVRDMVSKNRNNRTVGSKNFQAKLDIKQVQDIRYLYKNSNTSHRKLAKQFGITHSSIYSILNDQTWKEPAFYAE